MFSQSPYSSCRTIGKTRTAKHGSRNNRQATYPTSTLLSKVFNLTAWDTDNKEYQDAVNELFYLAARRISPHRRAETLRRKSQEPQPHYPKSRQPAPCQNEFHAQSMTQPESGNPFPAVIPALEAAWKNKYPKEQKEILIE